MKTFKQFLVEAVERRTYKVSCSGLDYKCDPLDIDAPAGTPTKSFHHKAKSRFLAKAFYKLRPDIDKNVFFRRHYDNCKVIKL